jgi:KUP system potassium uptake protein
MSPGGAPEISTEPPRHAEEELGESRSHHAKGRLAITLAALGVVFGDIGTSPLYAMHTVFAIDRELRPDASTVYGVISLVFWAITLVVTVKYVTLIMRADNHGEGGIMALIALVRGIRVDRRSTKLVLVSLGIFGAALFYGDGMITPAISVLSAVEGLEVAAPSVDSLVVPITLTILTVLFAVQRFGTGVVGRAFGPVMALWFGILAISGLAHVVQEPGILRALSPHYGIAFLFEHGFVGFLALGAVVLAITGAEALYADMGHFGRHAIRRAWLFVVFPALTLNYMGQGTLILGDRGAVDNPFFLLFPHWLRVPMVVVATVAAIIASQAVISGAFSVTRQAVQLGFLPRLNIVQTSARAYGQVYIPALNWFLLIMVLAAVLGFGSSSNLAQAYGVALTGTMLVTTILTFFVIRYAWGYPLWLCVFATGFFFLIDVVFFASAMLKVPHGGWFPLAIGVAVFVVMTTWRRGREVMFQRLNEASVPLAPFLKSLFREPPHRVDGTAIFLTATPDATPHALLHNLNHNKVLHERVVFLTVEIRDVPWVSFEERVTCERMGHGCWRVSVRYGFMNRPDVMRALDVCGTFGLDFDMMQTSFFLSRQQVVPGSGGPSTMARWRERMFAAMARNAGNVTDYFGIPTNRVIELGTRVEI